ncbi:MAG: T9SS type A sorting domain-containing protein, partial [Thermonemataceae bacterium]|nr:T9SS type A sorting domain-containing protein [Thermonemataceae bacterium]
IFPNPTEDKLQINLPQELKGKQQIHLKDVLGRIVLVKNMDNQEKIALDITFLPKGLYILEVQNSSHKAIRKVVKR